MIFRECDLGSPLNDNHALIIPPLIIALRPQVAPYHQALALFYQQSYIYVPPFTIEAFETKFQRIKPLVRKIAIDIKPVFSFAWNHDYRTVLRKDDTAYFFPKPESIESIFEGAFITHAHISLSSDGLDLSADGVGEMFLYNFPMWLEGFRNLTYVEVFIPAVPRYPVSRQQEKYDEIIGIRSDSLISHAPRTGSLSNTLMTWVARPGETIDWSKAARHLQGLSEEM